MSDIPVVNDIARSLHRRAAELTRGAYLPTGSMSSGFYVSVYSKEARAYRVLPGSFTSYAGAETAAAELHQQAQDALADLREVTSYNDYRYSPLQALRFIPMSHHTWGSRLTSTGHRK